MLITHELPKQLLKHNMKINDFDFVLFHLYKEDAEYKQYYLDMRKNHPDRLMILDNSAYEFYVKGEELDLGEYNGVIMELQPDYHIVPDVLMNKEETYNKFESWMYHYVNMRYYDEVGAIEFKSKPMIVPQGRTFQEFFSCYRDMIEFLMEGDERDINMNNVAFAIPFHNDFFKEMGSLKEVDGLADVVCKFNTNEDSQYALGRCRVMDVLEEWNTKHDVSVGFHMLGSHDPKEFKYLSKFNMIHSMDTSYPVKLAYAGKKLEGGYTKPDILIDSIYNEPVTQSVERKIKFNANVIRAWIQAGELLY